jgi:CRP/FNR family transcriptional regulator, cyclic AMP receptor protein
MIDSETLSRVTLFADLDGPQLEEVAHTLDEERFASGNRVVRKGLSNGGFYVILEGTASVVVDGDERAVLRPGDFFGEASILSGDVAIADVVAQSELRCAVAEAGDLRPLLLRFPSIATRMLEAGARRLRAANEWQP